MKNYIYIFLVLFLFSCDNLEDYFNGLNTAPKIIVEGQNDEGILLDSLKYVEICDNCKRFDYYIEDLENDVKEISFTTTGGIISQNGEPVNAIDPGLNIFYFKPENLGKTTISLTAKDNFGEESSSKIDLFVFDNLPPVADLVLNELNEDLPLEYNFDASGSHDGDEKYGGFILGYEYKIVLPNKTQEIKTTNDKFDYTFPSQGNYEIYLKVIDSDSVRSEEVKKILLIG